MCGLYGFINRGSSKINVNGLVKGMAVSAMSRGKDATGVAYNVSKSLCVIKAATPADKFVIDLPKSVNALIGHTRATTQGSELNNYNNHPFTGVGGKQTMFALAHNGVLDNDYDLQESECLPDTKIQTDSYVAVQLLEKYSKDDKCLTVDSIVKMSELVSGMFAFSILDNNNHFWLVRNDSPIYMVYFPSMKLYVYGSTEVIVKAGLKSAGLTQKYSVIKVDAGTILHIDLDGVLSHFKFTPSERVNKWSSAYAIASGSKYGYDYGYGYGYSKSLAYHIEDDLRYESYDVGLTDDEFDLLLQNYNFSEIQIALEDGSLPNLLLESLRDYYADNYNKRTEPYVSPIYK